LKEILIKAPMTSFISSARQRNSVVTQMSAFRPDAGLFSKVIAVDAGCANIGAEDTAKGS
jgi:hypothetical protein